MGVGRVTDEIWRAVATLQFGADEFHALPKTESERTLHRAFQHFVADRDPTWCRWWWESFREMGTSRRFVEGDGWLYIPEIAPTADEPVWFIAEDCQAPHYPIFETTPRIASRVIGECFLFEYYIIAKDLSWLLCETHHDSIFAVGPAVEQRLLDLKR